MRLRLLLLLCASVAFTGCQTEPAEGSYLPPPAGADVATVRGCVVHGATFLEGNHEARVRFVDMLKVSDRGGPEAPVVLAAGRHKLLVAYRNSTFRSQAELPLDAVAGGDYRVKIRAVKDDIDDQRYCEFWIEEGATGKMLGEKVRREVSGTKRESLFRVAD